MQACALASGPTRAGVTRMWTNMIWPARFNALAVGDEQYSEEVERFKGLVDTFEVLTRRLADTSDHDERVKLIRTARELVVESRELSQRVLRRVDAMPRPAKRVRTRKESKT